MNRSEPANIEYAGTYGISEYCLNALFRYLHFGDKINSCRIITHEHEHALLLDINYGSSVLVKAGFGSGYNGEGPRTFSMALHQLNLHEIDMDEVEVTSDVFKRLNSSYATKSDIEKIKKLDRILPSRLWDYMYYLENEAASRWLSNAFPVTINFRILDSRLLEIGRRFFENPDASLLDGYRQLEVIVRRRIDSSESGVKLLSRAFAGEDSKLTWGCEDTGELKGRSQLFISTFMAFRNKRAHSTANFSNEEEVREFYLLNMLYKLESEAIKREVFA